MPKYYCIVSQLLFRSSILTPTQKLVYIAIKTYTTKNKDGSRNPCSAGSRRIASDIGIKKNTVLKAIKDLECLGLLLSESIGGRRKKYRVLDGMIDENGYSFNGSFVGEPFKKSGSLDRQSGSPNGPRVGPQTDQSNRGIRFNNRETELIQKECSEFVSENFNFPGGKKHGK